MIGTFNINFNHQIVCLSFTLRKIKIRINSNTILENYQDKQLREVRTCFTFEVISIM